MVAAFCTPIDFLCFSFVACQGANVSKLSDYHVIVRRVSADEQEKSVTLNNILS
jgi:hypothetical protein